MKRADGFCVGDFLLYIYTVKSYIYGAFHVKSTMLKPLQFFFFFVQVFYKWPQKMTLISDFFEKFWQKWSVVVVLRAVIDSFEIHTMNTWLYFILF